MEWNHGSLHICINNEWIMERKMTMAPPYACQSCAARDAIVFCPVDGARLCVYCDVDVHGASTLAGLHQRAPLCDFCGAAAAAMRCAATFMVCTDCPSLVDLPGPTRADVTGYIGCPGPTELMRLLSVEAPPQQEEFDAWLHRLLVLKLDDDDATAVTTSNSNGGGMCDVAIAAAKIEKLLSDYAAAADGGSASTDYYAAAAGCSSSTDPADGNNKEENGTKQTTMIQDQQRKRQERERAKLRYNEKKKNRSFCKHIMYASRKQTADTRTRVKGRFAKASSSSSEPHRDRDQLVPSICSKKE